MRSSAILVVLALSLPLSVGCAANKPSSPPAAAPTQAAALPLPPAPADDGIQTGGLHISEAIVRACGLKKAPAPPMFDFDSATLAEQDRMVLADVARCFSEGPMRGQSMSLIGRADPRGEDEYNMALGETRADTVERYLRDLGVAQERVSATSRGKIDAMGRDEDGWAKDRRVDIELASR
jgi:peptidoglycan-associated lipoprotein